MFGAPQRMALPRIAYSARGRQIAVKLIDRSKREIAFHENAVYVKTSLRF
jgi:hypothetical protein